jgi:lysophospholipase L1-like esterase
MILLTYSAFPLPGRPPLHVGHAKMSEAMAAFANEEGLPMVDVRPRFLELLPEGTPRSQLFHNEREGHPNPRGYAEIARALADYFEPAEGEPAAEKGKKPKP